MAYVRKIPKNFTVRELILLGVNVYFNDKRVGFGVLMDFIIECKITPGMELFEQQYFTEQYFILTRTEEGYEKD